jgi:hypothetical protein
MVATRNRGSSGDRGYGGSDRGRGRGRGHGLSSHGRSSNSSSSRPQCQVCLKFGHTTNNYWHRYEEKYVSEQRTTAAASSTGADPAWYTDSSSTDHITSDLDHLMMHDPYTSHVQVHAANRLGMDITRIGTSTIPTTTGPLTLNDVLHVPSANKNLIYVHRFMLDNDTFIEFHPYFFLIKDQKMKKILLHGQCKGGLYPLSSSTSKFRKLIFNAIKISVDRWHSRLGHPSRDIVHCVISKNNLPCAALDSSGQFVCDACACAKAHQLPYQLSSSRSSAPLELIFSDVWGL